VIGAGEAAPSEAVGRSLREQAELLARGTASSRDLVDEALARIGATQDTLNAFRLVCPEEARRDAA
jgi:amidase